MLPIRQIQEVIELKSRRVDQIVSLNGDSPKILIIDDDDQIRRLLFDLLSERYQCKEVSSAEDALLVLAQESFDLVVSDINMGGMSGLELVPHVKSLSADNVVLMISGQSTIESAIEAMRVGAFDYVMKPLDIRHVEAAVERALQHACLLKENHRYKDWLEELLTLRTAEVNRLEYYDTLTELPNRNLFEDRLDQAVAVSLRTGDELAILFISLDQLKQVNDTLGHLSGDLLIKKLAERLRSCVTEGDTVARFGGDEFAILLTDIEAAKDVVEIIGSIQEVLRPPFTVYGHDVYATASVGVCLFPEDGKESGSLMKNASSALYRVKKAGGDNFRFYTEDMNIRASKQFALETSLRHALDNEELVLHYQPKLAVDSLEIIGLEALVRWQHPKLGMVSPADFIPLAEDSGLILPIGEWVLRTACQQNRAWQEQGFAPMRVSVNVSARQFHQPHLGEIIIEILDETGLNPSCLDLELTESSIMSNAQAAIDVLTKLKALGVTVSIDDFGTGFSSLSYLKRLPIDALKIDQSFVRDVTTDPDDAALVMAIVTLAHNLRLQVIAEGVETEQQLKFLHLLRCDEVQGYLFSKPLPAAELEKLLTPGSNKLHTHATTKI